MSARTKSAAVLAVVLASVAWAQAPQKLAYQGLLLKLDGTPETGTQTIRFSVHDAASSGNELWFESQNIMLTQGYYATVLGDTTALPGSVFNGSERYLEVAVNGTPLTPRMRIVSVPYALQATQATTATNVSGGTVNATSVQVNGTTVIDSSGALAGNTAYAGVNGITVNGRNIGLRNCAAGEILRWDSSNSTWQCATYVAPNTDAGVVAYTADPDGGLELLGSNATAFSLLRSCGADQVLKWSGSAWVCADDVDTNTTYGAAAGQGLAMSGASNNLFGLKLCASGKVLKSGGGNWDCADDSDSQYTATVNGGLILNGNGLSIDACPDGYVMKATSTVGQWACAADSDTQFGVVANGGLLKAGNNFRLDTCPNTQVMKSLGSGQWGCSSDNNSGGTVTSITAGTGLTGGIISSSGTIGLAGTVPNWTAFLPATCSAGQALRSIALDGTPVCDPISSAGTVTSIVGAGGVITSPDAGITTTGTISLAPTVQNWTAGQPGCAVGQAIQSISANGTVSCITVSLDGGTGGGSVTQVNSGAGLTGGPITGSGTLSIDTGGVTNAMLQNSFFTVDAGNGLSGGGTVALGGSVTLALAGPVSVANGGTGATTATNARANLVAAKSGANSDITSLSGLTTALSVAQGGTGSTTQNFVDLTNNQSIDGVKTFTYDIVGDITGNAGSVTNGVYTTGSYTDPSWIQTLAGTKVSGNISGNAAGFTGSLAGDVIGNQGTTTVVGLRGRPVASTLPSADQVLAWNGTTWVPASVNATAPVVINSNTIGLAPCATGQVLKADGGTWLCAPDNNSGGTVTSITAGAGLTGGTITGSGTLSIADGGVSNRMLANASITVTPGTGLTGGGAVALGGSVGLSLSTPVLPVNGGTGLATGPATAGLYLRSSDAGTWATSPLLASDIPSLSGVYVDLSGTQTITGTKTFSSTIVGDISGNAAGFTSDLAGDVTGKQAATVVGKIQGTPVAATAPTAGQALVYSTLLAGGWRPVSPGGDLGGNFASTTVTGLQGNPVSATTPGAGQVLQYSAGGWAPATITEGDGVIGNEVTGAANTTLTRSGSGTSSLPYLLSLNLLNANTWTGAQTFSGGANVSSGQVLDMQGVSSLRFNSTTSSAVPMIYMFSVGSDNGTRMVIGHSPAYPQFGMLYDDTTDAFRFQWNDAQPPSLFVDLNSTQVSVGSNPVGSNAFTVTGSTYLNGSTTVNGTLGVNSNASVSGSLSVVGSTTMNSALNVVGDVTTASEFRYSTARARNYYQPASTMSVTYSDDTVIMTNQNATGYISAGTAPYDAWMMMPVNVPDGAVITALYCDYFDNAVANLTVNASLFRRSQSSTIIDTMASISVTTNDAVSAGRRQSSSTISFATVDDTYTYFIQPYYSQTATGSGTRFLGCGVSYTVARAD